MVGGIGILIQNIVIVFPIFETMYYNAPSGYHLTKNNCADYARYFWKRIDQNNLLKNEKLNFNYYFYNLLINQLKILF